MPLVVCHDTILYMTYETEEQFKKRSREAEVVRESREAKEGEIDEELKTAAAMERADYLVKEVKQSKKQMQNILLHMQQVTKAIRELRQQLQLAGDGDATSVEQDKERIEELKKKIKEYQEEIVAMRGDLVREQMEELKEGVGVGVTAEELKKRAEGMVDKMIKEIVET